MNWKMIGIGLILIVLLINMGCTEGDFYHQENYCEKKCKSNTINIEECKHSCLLDLIEANNEGNSKDSKVYVEGEER